MDASTDQPIHETAQESEPLLTAAAETTTAEDLLSAQEKENLANKNGFEGDMLLEEEELNPKYAVETDFIKNSQPTTDLEIALTAVIARKERHITKITNELLKLKSFMTKRKQTYKRKKKDEAAPTRALSAYNVFVKERFAKLAKRNEDALMNEDSDATLKRVPPANLVAATGNEWKELSAEEKQIYEERAKEDRRRYDEEMAQYRPAYRKPIRKRNKTGYNMYYSAHVLRLKQTEGGVPTEQGSVARVVGENWRRLSAEERQFYEREADKHNDANPLAEEDDEPEEDDRRHAIDFFNHMHAPHNPDMHMYPPMPHMQYPQHDPRHFYPPPPLYGQANYYDYSQHHQRQQQPARGPHF